MKDKNLSFHKWFKWLEDIFDTERNKRLEEKTALEIEVDQVEEEPSFMKELARLREGKGAADEDEEPRFQTEPVGAAPSKTVETPKSKKKKKVGFFGSLFSKKSKEVEDLKPDKKNKNSGALISPANADLYRQRTMTTVAKKTKTFTF